MHRATALHIVSKDGLDGQSSIPNYCYQIALIRPAPLKALGYHSNVTIVMVYQHPTFLVPLLMMDL